MLLELLRLVAVVAGGLPSEDDDGGGALAELVLDTDLSMPAAPGGGGAPRLGSDRPAEDGGVRPPPVPTDTERGGPPAGGALARPPASEPGRGEPMAVGGGGAGLELVERGVALGGGGVAFLALLSSALAFLFTQRLSSGS